MQKRGSPKRLHRYCLREYGVRNKARLLCSHSSSEISATPSPLAEREKLVSATQCLEPFASDGNQKLVAVVVSIGSASTWSLGGTINTTCPGRAIYRGAVKLGASIIPEPNSAGLTTLELGALVLGFVSLRSATNQTFRLRTPKNGRQSVAVLRIYKPSKNPQISTVFDGDLSCAMGI